MYEYWAYYYYIIIVMCWLGSSAAAAAALNSAVGYDKIVQRFLHNETYYHVKSTKTKLYKCVFT